MGSCCSASSRVDSPSIRVQRLPAGSIREKDKGRDKGKGLAAASFSGDDLSSTYSLCSNLRVFSFKDLKTATDNFPGEGDGDGGVGGVFKGWIQEHGTSPAEPGRGIPVLVKFLKAEGLQPVREWMAEVQFLGSLDHRNLVKLYGYCCERGNRLLVYEYVSNGSLAEHLFFPAQAGCAAALAWNTRMEIALGAAQGIAYLHTPTPERRVVIYRDFKTSNVLLDGDYTAKLTDFGLADENAEGDSSFVSTRVMATHGYGAPEFVMSGYLVPKSNVYSFGVVLLELLTGRRAVDKGRPPGEQNLVEWARPFLRSEKQKLLQIVDPRLEGKFSMKAAWKAGRLAHRCLSLDPRLRPPMVDVADALEMLQDLNDMAADDPGYHRWSALTPVAPHHRSYHSGPQSLGGGGFMVDDGSISEYQAQLRAISESHL